jgi:iron complex transport system substrate-binding protein
VALHGGSVDEILRVFVEASAVLGALTAGEELVVELRAKLSHVKQRVQGLPRPRVACVEWIAPVFAMGNWGPELVELAGGDNLLGRPGQHSTTLSFAAICEADPDVLIVAPCGFGLSRAWGEMPALAAEPGFAELRAVRAGRVYVCDGNLYFNRSSPSLFETPRLLAEMLHPAQIAPEHEGTVWRRWPTR